MTSPVVGSRFDECVQKKKKKKKWVEKVATVRWGWSFYWPLGSIRGDAVGPLTCGARCARPTRYPGHKNRNKRRDARLRQIICVWWLSLIIVSARHLMILSPTSASASWGKSPKIGMRVVRSFCVKNRSDQRHYSPSELSTNRRSDEINKSGLCLTVAPTT